MSAKLYGLTEFAKLLGSHLNCRKMSVYYSRGKLPEPIAFSGSNQSRPLWTRDQIQQYIKEKDGSKKYQGSKRR